MRRPPQPRASNGEVLKASRWLEKLYNEGKATTKSLGDYYGDIADASTKQIRLGLLRQKGTTDRVEGISLQRTAYIRIEWTWLVLLMALLALDIAVLACMIARSVRYRDQEAVWKSNALPLLYYKSRFVGLEPEKLSHSAYDPLEMASAETDRFMTSAELEAIAQKVKVRLRRSGPGEAEAGGAPGDEDVESRLLEVHAQQGEPPTGAGAPGEETVESRLLEPNARPEEPSTGTSTSVAPR